MAYQHRTIADLARYNDSELRILFAELKETCGDWEAVWPYLVDRFNNLQAYTAGGVRRKSLDWTWVLWMAFDGGPKTWDIDREVLQAVGDRWFLKPKW